MIVSIPQFGGRGELDQSAAVRFDGRCPLGGVEDHRAGVKDRGVAQTVEDGPAQQIDG